MLTRLLGVLFGLFDWKESERRDVDDLLLGSCRPEFPRNAIEGRSRWDRPSSIREPGRWGVPTGSVVGLPGGMATNR